LKRSRETGDWYRVGDGQTTNFRMDGQLGCRASWPQESQKQQCITHKLLAGESASVQEKKLAN